MNLLIILCTMIVLFFFDLLSAIKNYKKNPKGFEVFEQNKNLVYALKNKHGLHFSIAEFFLVILISFMVATAYLLVTKGNFWDGWIVGLLTQIFVNLLGICSNLYVFFKLENLNKENLLQGEVKK